MGGTITIVGLGSGTEEDLTLAVYRKLISSPSLFVRTQHHPVIAFLTQEKIQMTFFDDIYEQSDRFEDVYESICSALLKEAADKDIIYAVPGHPTVAEKSVKLLLKQGPENGIHIDLLNGPSFMDQCFTRLHIDPIEGFMMLDALSFNEHMLNPAFHTVVCQVYDSYVASDVKLSLMEIYPDDYEVIVGISLGITGEEQIHRVPLFEMDRINGYNNVTLVYIPPMTTEPTYRTFSRLVEIIATLRGPNGCPWDLKQSHQSLKPYLLEEAYELIDEIDEENEDGIRDELGDLLLQVLLHAQIGKDEGFYHIYDVIESLNRKLIRRHPHVFGEEVAHSPEDVAVHWQRIKQEEKSSKGETKESILSGIPNALPAMMAAYKLQKKAAKVGFDWENIEDVFSKVIEELQEIKDAKTAEEKEEELGDLLFAVINVARSLQVDPEFALARTNDKFKRRFHYIEQTLKDRGVSLESADLYTMDQLWNEAKTTK